MNARSTKASAGGPNLFAAAGLEQDAPRPLADKLRPQKLSDVVGQDHLLGPDGVLTRMLEARSLGSMVFWGPPGTGKTTAVGHLADKMGKRLTALNLSNQTEAGDLIGGFRPIDEAEETRSESWLRPR